MVQGAALPDQLKRRFRRANANPIMFPCQPGAAGRHGGERLLAFATYPLVLYCFAHSVMGGAQVFGPAHCVLVQVTAGHGSHAPIILKLRKILLLALYVIYGPHHRQFFAQNPARVVCSDGFHRGAKVAEAYAAWQRIQLFPRSQTVNSQTVLSPSSQFLLCHT